MITRKAFVAISVVVLCIVLIAVLVVELTSNTLGTEGENTRLYVSSYVSGPNFSNSTVGNLVLVNPTSDSLQNLTIAIQVDGCPPIVPTLRLWNSNYNLTMPGSQLQSELLNIDSINFSSPATSICIEPKQKAAINLVFPSPESLSFSSHNLTVYVSQENFGDLINGAQVTIPQTRAYLQIESFSSIVTDQDTYHEYFNSTLNDYLYINDNPDFCQRYFNHSWQIHPGNYHLAAYMGVLQVTYFNVTVYNNNTFPVNSVMLVGQIPSRGSCMTTWGAQSYHVIQPKETYVFPVSQNEKPTYWYVTGYLSNSTAPNP
jgi:hypothetical protein